MKKKLKIKKIIYLILLIGIIGSVLYYFYPRNVAFSLYREFDITNKEEFFPYHYVDNEDIFCVLLIKENGYDSVFVTDIAKKIDFINYNYIITFNKNLLKLSYSPYYTDFEDGCPSVKLTPLIPKYSQNKTNKMYIYKIKKNSKFRGICG